MQSYRRESPSNGLTAWLSSKCPFSFKTDKSLILVNSLKRNNQTELFEDNQRDLERAVENLSYLLEQNIGEPESIAKLRHDVTNQAAYVQKRHEIMMDDTLRGHLEVSSSLFNFVGTDTDDCWGNYSIVGSLLWTFKTSSMRV